MKISVDTRGAEEAAVDLLAIPLSTVRGRSPKVPNGLANLDRSAGGPIRTVLANRDFSGKTGESLLVYPSSTRSRCKRILLLGLGDAKNVDAESLRKAAGRAVGQARAKNAGRVAMLLSDPKLSSDLGNVQALAEGAVLADYRFDDYRGAREGDSSSPKSFALLLARGAPTREARAAASRGTILAESQNVARQLSNEPANFLPPAELARAARSVARETGLKVRVFDVAQLKRRKMGAILAVGGGSVHEPRLIVLEHRPSGRRPAGERPFCMVGKGITFDSGGISIKPSAGMDEMKHDMSGAATVVGAMRACALLDLPYPVVGVIAAAENLPSATAYRPGDVVTTMSGKTIEVLNTDAEGRVVLADALHYARTEFDPCAMVDLATLTGACMVALGRFATGLFGNHPRLNELVRAAGDAVSERAWPMPLLPEHKEEIRSQVADIKNAGVRHAGASTAAAFLWHFAEDTPWVHLDIAGTGWTGKTGPYQPRGATGVGVRLLLEVLRDFDESRLEA